jgi:hypothetical protein
MDHAPKAHGALLPPIDEPLFLKREHSWDPNVGYEEFLDHKGFYIQDIIGGKLDQHSKGVLSVVQGWGFFGTIGSICQLVFVPLKMNDFIRCEENGELFITTVPLPNVLRIWIFHERRVLPSEGRPEVAKKIR